METPKIDTSSNLTPSDSRAAAVVSSTPELEKAIDRASNAAVEQHVAEQPTKRGRGRPKGSFKKIPVDGLDNGSADPLLAENATSVLPVNFQNRQTMSEESIRTLVKGFAGIVEDFGCGILRACVLKDTGNKDLANEAALGGKMSEQNKEMIITGGVDCFKKYLGEFEYGPELMLGIGLGGYAIGISSQIRASKEKSQELKQQAA